MFFIYANDKIIYQPMVSDCVLISPKLILEMGKSGSLEFRVPPTNNYYNSFKRLSTVITVKMDDVEIFRGRVLTNDRDFHNIRTIYCEGNLSYLVDSCQKAEKFDGQAHDLFRYIIASHNMRVEPEKQFTVGDITIDNRAIHLYGQSDETEDPETGEIDYDQIAINSVADEWMNTYDFIQKCIIDYTGGYLRTRRNNGITYIDLLSDYNSTSEQEIEFGKNLLDYTENISSENIFTVLVPIGDNNLTIESVNDGIDELVDEDKVKIYGRIMKTHVFNNVNNPETLLENGLLYLENNSNVPSTITVRAVDMHFVSSDVPAIYVGDKVHIVSDPHEVYDTLTCTKIEYDISNPSNNNYTFGEPVQSLTERYRKDKELAKGGGGTAAETADDEGQKKLDEFFDAWININPESAHVDLGSLYKKFKDTIEILESSCGISMDAPSGNVNIKTLRQEFDDLSIKTEEASANIDLLTTDMQSKIELITARHDDIQNLENSHYTELITLANANESSIAANTESIRQIEQGMNESKTSITQLSNELNAQISLETEHTETLNGKIDKNTSSISQLSSSLNSQIRLEASHNNDNANRIASLEVMADANHSAILLKADKTTVDSDIFEITGRLAVAELNLTELNAGMANIETIIAQKIESADISSLIAKAHVIQASVAITSGVSIQAPVVYAGDRLIVHGKDAATEEYVDNKLTSYATQNWVNNRGFLKTLPDNISVKTVKASEKMTIGPYLVATQAWCMSTKNFATVDWVKSQLANYVMK